jgi:hypothetical protein
MIVMDFRESSLNVAADSLFALTVTNFSDQSFMKVVRTQINVAFVGGWRDLHRSDW